MRTRRSTASRGLVALGAAAGLLATLGGASPAFGQSAPSGPTATISMRSEGGLRFTGSKQVVAGQPLRIRNLSDPRDHGPHTFTLVASNVVPSSRRAQNRCFTPGRICLLAAIAHEFDERTEKVNRQLVEEGSPGWDRRFSRTSRRGDSWYSERKGEVFEQVVSARAGSVLRYMCVIHPNMQGKIKVVRG